LTALSAAIFTAVAMLGLHSLGEIEPLPIVVHFSAVATVFCLVAFLVGPRQHDPSRVLEWNVLWKVVAMGLTALVGQVFLTLAFGSGAPSKVSVVGLSQIVFALAFDVWLFGYKVNKVTMIGIVFVIAPTAWLLTRSRSGPIRSGDNPAQDLPQLDAAARQPSSG
jgi:drug/metabolite transporter (DMT)-like permease